MLRHMLATTWMLLLISSCTDRNHRYQDSIRAFEKPMTPPAHTVRQVEPSRRPQVNLELLKQGQILYENNCVSCHGVLGNGHGIVTKKGLNPPTSFMDERLLNAPESHFVNVMTNGLGRMVSVRRRLKMEERWAVASYVKALQLSRKIPKSSLDESDKKALP